MNTKKATTIKGNDFFSAWQRPTLAGGNPQLPSALKSLTTVFEMGTGVTSSLLPPDLNVLFQGHYLLYQVIQKLQALVL